MISPPNDTLAADPKAVQALANKVMRDPQGVAREVARQFEALLLETMLKGMRAVSFDGEAQSHALQTYRGLLDQQRVQALTHSKGIGFASLLEQHIRQAANLTQNRAEEPILSPPAPSKIFAQKETIQVQALTP